MRVRRTWMNNVLLPYSLNDLEREYLPRSSPKGSFKRSQKELIKIN